MCRTLICGRFALGPLRDSGSMRFFGGCGGAGGLRQAPASRPGARPRRDLDRGRPKPSFGDADPALRAHRTGFHNRQRFASITQSTGRGRAMGNITIRNLDDRMIDAWKARAKTNHARWRQSCATCLRKRQSAASIWRNSGSVPPGSPAQPPERPRPTAPRRSGRTAIGEVYRRCQYRRQVVHRGEAFGGRPPARTPRARLPARRIREHRLAGC